MQFNYGTVIAVIHNEENILSINLPLKCACFIQLNIWIDQ